MGIWLPQEELKGMAGRIKAMRAQLLTALKEAGAPGTWDHVVQQIGMFSFLGVTKVRPAKTPRSWRGLSVGLRAAQSPRARRTGEGLRRTSQAACQDAVERDMV